MDVDSTNVKKDSIPTEGLLGMAINVSKDTMDVTYFQLGDPNKINSFKDTSLVHFEDYDLLKGFDEFNLTLGIPASSHKTGLLKLPDANIFTRTHQDNYESLRSTVDDFVYYRLKRPFNDLFVSPMGSQDDFFVKANFSKDFKESINLSLNYWRVANNGEYQSQLTKATSFNIGFWIKNPGKPHQIFISFLANNFNENYNGGVTNLDALLQDKEFPNIRTEENVYLSGAASRNQEYQIAVDNYFGNLSNWSLYHRILYRSFFFRFSDIVNNDAFYGDLFVDHRGLRNSHKNDVVQNILEISKNSKYIDLAVGLSQQYLSYSTDGLNEGFNDLSVHGSLSASIKKLSLNGIGKLGLLDSGENLFFRSWLSFNANSWFELTGGFQIKQWKANIADRFTSISQIPVWSNAFNRSLESNIFASFSIPKTSTSLSAVFSNNKDGIYYNENALPYQLNESINSFRISLKQSLGIRWIQSDHIVHIQSFDNNVQNLPNVLSKHKLYFKLYLFKQRLKTHIGASYSQFFSQNGSIAFMPLTTTFYPSSNAMPNNHNLDFFLNLKIENFRVYFLAENATYLINRQVNLQIENVPQWDFNFRFGVRWIMTD